MRDWEKAKRESGPKAKEHTISSITKNGEMFPITLEEIENQNKTTQLDMFTYEGDEYGCFCEY